ncbi:unnamed protein product [Chondrus crispus]|uniref:Uncharacterized protein n=1 Tax=Chondrus crispus TaxID=2769 RepID=R7QPC6_CHOCR|nr:unnamed protein product [Chondrus crispus]CDF39623.1 unnamed protein product [Chondrus crispus]|eukprot:XP_005709917.1 unnamed protein product [Chondrus crispus]
MYHRLYETPVHLLITRRTHTALRLPHSYQTEHKEGAR